MFSFLFSFLPGLLDCLLSLLTFLPSSCFSFLSVSFFVDIPFNTVEVRESTRRARARILCQKCNSTTSSFCNALYHREHNSDYIRYDKICTFRTAATIYYYYITILSG